MLEKADRIRSFTDLKDAFHVDYIEREAPYSMAFHIHEAYEIMLVVSGNIAIDVNEESYPVPAGSILLFNTMDLHRVRICGEGAYKRYVIYFKYDFLKELEPIREELLRCFYMRGFDKANLLIPAQEDKPRFLDLFHRIEKEKDRKNESSRELANKLLLGELLVLINETLQSRNEEHAYPGKDESAAVYQAIRYVQAHLSEELRPEFLAKTTSADPRKLSAGFRQITGMTTGQYILNYRLTAAKAFLVQNMPVSEVCERTGFGDYSNFSRTFRKHVGLSPKQYAVKYREI